MEFKLQVHSVYEYAQDYILQDYIDFNTKKCASAKNDFERDFFKLSNNSIYGKMLQDILKQNDCVITTDDNVALKHFSDPAFKSAQFAEETYFISKAKKSVKYNRPTYVGTTILDLSKVLMLDFHYGYMKPKYGDKCELLYTVTDSFV